MKKIYLILAVIAILMGGAGVYFFYLTPAVPVRPMPKFTPKSLPGAAAPAPQTRTLPLSAPSPSRLLAVDLENDGLDMEKGGEKYFFDTDGDMLAEDIDWVAPADAVLMADCQKGTALHTLEELKKYDTDGNGVVDINDRAFLDLGLWSDQNLDAVCQEEEIRLLPDLGITAIVSEDPETLKPVTIYGASARLSGFLRGKENFDLYEVSFVPVSAQTRYVGPRNVSEEVAALPNLKGMGKLIDLHFAAMADPGLKDYLSRLKKLDPKDAAQFMPLYTQMLERWGKVEHIPSAEKKAGLPRRKLALLARVSGIDEEEWQKNSGGSLKINEIYDDFYYATAQAIMVQTLISSALPYYAAADKKAVSDDDLKNIFAQALSINAMHNPVLLLLVYDVIDSSLQNRTYNQQVYNENMTALFTYNNLVYMRPAAQNHTYFKAYGDIPVPAGKSGVFVNSPGNGNFTGGTGNDIYYYRRGDGLDTINEKGGLNHIIMPDIAFAELEFKNEGLDLQILLKNAGNQGLIIKNYFAGPQYQVDSIDFNNGSLLKLNTVEENIKDSIFTRINMWFLKLKL